MVENTYHINTIGCQMNVYDSEQMISKMEGLGYRRVPEPEQAALILMNTCAIREKAEQKVFSFLGRLADLKRREPRIIIAVGGCVAQQEGERILRRVPHVDLVFGTHAISRLPDHIKAVRKRRCRIVDVELTGGLDFFEPARSPDPEKIGRFVTIMQGCDNYCAYCVVPYVRGREASRHPDRIVAEIRHLVEQGVREVTLLGQNVNSYGMKEGLCSFPELLRRIDRIDGLERIRFTTSHPKDLSDELIGCFGTVEKLCHHIHLPVQSGADRILRRMNRKYTRDGYLGKIDALRTTVPDMAVSSDLIVGFPGETESELQDTLSLVRQVQFDGLFAFMYSDRPNAPAARFPGKLTDDVKRDRLRRLLELQNDISGRKNRSLVGTVQEILVEGESKKQMKAEGGSGSEETQWTGRTTQNRIVNFLPDPGRRVDFGIGQLLCVGIEKAFPHSLWGRPVGDRPGLMGSKGEDSYAA